LLVQTFARDAQQIRDSTVTFIDRQMQQHFVRDRANMLLTVAMFR
jgi:hypothetical protein